MTLPHTESHVVPQAAVVYSGSSPVPRFWPASSLLWSKYPSRREGVEVLGRTVKKVNCRIGNQVQMFKIQKNNRMLIVLRQFLPFLRILAISEELFLPAVAFSVQTFSVNQLVYHKVCWDEDLRCFTRSLSQVSKILVRYNSNSQVRKLTKTEKHPVETFMKQKWMLFLQIH